MLPELSQATGTTRMPAMAALAGLVPWAEVGMADIAADVPTRLVARMTSKPAYSPWEPALGCKTAAKPVISASQPPVVGRARDIPSPG